MTKHKAAFAFLLLLFGLFPSCRAVGEHFEAQPWSDGLGQFSDHTEQWVPSAAMFAATPLLLIVDNSTSNESVEDKYFGTTTSHGDELALLLGLTPVVLGGTSALVSGDTRHLEVTAEATALTALETQFFKLVTNRQRPNQTSGNGDSFPSGHTSFSFCGATLLARWYSDTHDGSGLGYLLYLPAAYVGISRLEGDRHFLSDITFGAGLGMMTAHLVWNLHFGDEHHGGIFGRRADARLTPVVSEQGVGLALSVSF